MHRLDRIPKLDSSASLYLDERDQPVPLRNEIDIPVTAAEPPLKHTPPPPTEPSLGHPLANLAEFLPRR
jgi:hypothetical protein